MKITYKIARKIKVLAEHLWNGENKKFCKALDELKHHYNWSVNKTLRVMELVSRQFISQHYDADCGIYYPNWKEFKNLHDLENYLWTECCQYTMPTKELMTHTI